MTLNNPNEQSTANVALKVVEIISGLIDIKSPSIYYTGDKVNFSFKGGVNLLIKGKLVFTNKIVKLECDVTPKGITASKVSNAFVTELDQFFKL